MISFLRRDFPARAVENFRAATGGPFKSREIRKIEVTVLIWTESVSKGSHCFGESVEVAWVHLSKSCNSSGLPSKILRQSESVKPHRVERNAPVPTASNDFVISFLGARVEAVPLVHDDRQVSEFSGELEAPIIFGFKRRESDGEGDKRGSVVCRKGPPCFQEKKQLVRGSEMGDGEFVEARFKDEDSRVFRATVFRFRRFAGAGLSIDERDGALTGS